MRQKKTVRKKRSRSTDQVDRQSKESFPASDPPSFAGGNGIVGAPEDAATAGKKVTSSGRRGT